MNPSNVRRIQVFCGVEVVDVCDVCDVRDVCDVYGVGHFMYCNFFSSRRYGDTF